MESPTVTTTRARYLTVRFEDSCVLIPPQELPKPGLRPRLIRKSYSLPLWKASPSKKALVQQGPVVSTQSDAADGDKADKKPFSLVVSVPSLTTKTKPRRPSLPPSPCLTKRNPSSPISPASPLSPHAHDISPLSPLLRTPTFPAILPASSGEAETVPLRPCCEACHPCVDAALAGGERWAEKWSSGAVRRYSEGEHAKLHTHPPFGVTREWTPAGPDVPLMAALQVDEVEVKRRASDVQGSACVDENALADSDDESAPPILPMPVQQEDEDEDLLFPLPSPRRSPNPSPYATPLSGSQVSLTAVQPLPDPTSTWTGSSAPAPTLASLPPLTIPVSMPSGPVSPNRELPVASPIDISTPPRPVQGSPTRFRGSSPPATQPRRPSFSSASGSLLKGSAAVLKGVAAGMTGASVGVR